jgi:hypothetical protein
MRSNPKVAICGVTGVGYRYKYASEEGSLGATTTYDWTGRTASMSCSELSSKKSCLRAYQVLLKGQSRWHPYTYDVLRLLIPVAYWVLIQ